MNKKRILTFSLVAIVIVLIIGLLWWLKPTTTRTDVSDQSTALTSLSSGIITGDTITPANSASTVDTSLAASL